MSNDIKMTGQQPVRCAFNSISECAFKNVNYSSHRARLLIEQSAENVSF